MMEESVSERLKCIIERFNCFFEKVPKENYYSDLVVSYIEQAEFLGLINFSKILYRLIARGTVMEHVEYI